MDKKQYVLRMLDTLQDTWPLAKGLKILINAKPLDETLIDLLITTFKETIKTIDDEKQKDKVRKLWQETKELTLIFSKIAFSTKN